MRGRHGQLKHAEKQKTSYFVLPTKCGTSILRRWTQRPCVCSCVCVRVRVRVRVRVCVCVCVCVCSRLMDGSVIAVAQSRGTTECNAPLTHCNAPFNTECNAHFNTMQCTFQHKMQCTFSTLPFHFFKLRCTQ